jgi:hypothetical protein
VLHRNHRQFLRYENDGPKPYCYAQNNNNFKNNLCKKNASPGAQVNLQFSDQLIEAYTAD